MGKASKKRQGPPRTVEPMMMMNLHNGGCFSNHNLRMHHAMVTGTHLLKEKNFKSFYTANPALQHNNPICHKEL